MATINGNFLPNVLIGTGFADNINGFGGNDVLIGLAGNDVFDGAPGAAIGADVMIGGLGNDTYFVDNPGDVVVEGFGEGIDRIVSSISLSLSVVGRFDVENLTLTGGAITGIGNSLGNVITGTAAGNLLNGRFGNDLLSGGFGNDRLFGEFGNDRLIGGPNDDTFVFNTAPNALTNRDIVADFTNLLGNNDRFEMENAVYTALGAAGPLNPAFFRAGAAALDFNDHIIYNQAAGTLTYDSNGVFFGGATVFAVLPTHPFLTAADFTVI